MNLRRAFTLIELLIVVAIIAILAAIAVPNFLEAQTRSKVSRVKADHRTVGVAAESYRIDNNSYPVCGRLNREHDGSLRVKGGYLHMMEPIAYLTLMPEDPFGEQQLGDRTWPSSYWFKSGKDGYGPAGFDRPETTAQKVWPLDIYFVSSAGPDDLLIIEANDNPPGIGVFRDNKLGGFPTSTGWGGVQTGWGQHGNAEVQDLYVDNIYDIIYDPTNGTVSFGEIFRSGGSPGYTKTLQRFRAATE